MSVVKNTASAIGRLLIVSTLAITFLVGMFGVIYFQLRGEEVAIPKVVGKNFNDGREDLTDLGLRIKKIATRYSNEEPNTILEQRPRAGTTAKSGLMISVVVSEKNPDGRELPVELKDDEEVIGEIEQQPELRIDKPKAKTKAKKTSPKTRDLIEKKPDDEETGKPDDGGTKTETGTAKPADQKTDTKPADSNPPVVPTKPVPKPPAKPSDDNKKPKPNGDLRSRRVSTDN